jgi:hypothetical protein
MKVSADIWHKIDSTFGKGCSFDDKGNLRKNGEKVGYTYIETFGNTYLVDVTGDRDRVLFRIG